MTERSLTVKKTGVLAPAPPPASTHAPQKRTATKPARRQAKRASVRATAAKSTPKKTIAKKVTRKKTTSKTKSTTPPTDKNALLRDVRREPLGHLRLEQQLREAGFRGGISSDAKFLDRYATDESIFSIRPQVVVQPKRPEDVEIAVQVVAQLKEQHSALSLTPRAAGTGLSGGSLTDSVVIDVCSHLTEIGDVQHSGQHTTITCRPGAMWRDVEKKLAAADAYLPPFPASKDICSIGGAIANNAAGPDSLRHGHCADWVKSLEVVLADGHTYTIAPLSYKEFKALTKKKHLHACIAKEVFELIEQHEKTIKTAEPKTKKNSAGYALWDVLDVSVDEFKNGTGTFDLTRLISGSQGTVGIVTSVTLRAAPIAHDTTLIAVPVFDLTAASEVVTDALRYNPRNLEVFDALSYDLALKNPGFFRKRFGNLDYCKALLSMYTAYHLRYGRRLPEFTLLITLDGDTTATHSPEEIVATLSRPRAKARHVTNPAEAEMLWQIRRSSYLLSKLQDERKRPAAFLEDMTVPPEQLSKFFTQIKRLLQEFNVTAAVHGHGGNGHFHFYPLLDFTNKTTPALVEKMAERFFATAMKYGGNICGEHNDGIIRTPHLSKMFSKKALGLFKEVEHIFDPSDIFNPGKKVNPRFDVKETMRKTN